MLPPFTEPLAYVTDPDAWRGGKHRSPEWRRQPGTFNYDTPGIHRLVRAANLPRAELLHMGWADRLLSASAPEWLPGHVVGPLLGRIVCDAAYGANGNRWRGDAWDQAVAENHGAAVLRHWFHHA